MNYDRHAFKNQRRGHRLTDSASRILNYLFPQPDGASVRKIAPNLRLHYKKVQSVLHQLELAGEVFRKGKNWYSVAAALAFDPKPTIERLRSDLEHGLFGTEPTPKLREFLTEFSGGVKLGLSIDESFRLAQGKLLEVRA